MTVFMLYQSLTITETLVATFVGASKRSFSCMHLHMGLQSFPSSECPAAGTIFASQGALLVCAMMLNQFLTIMEGLAARVVLASERTLICVCLVMLIQCLTVIKSLAARLVLARERSLVCMSAAMPIQGPMVMKTLAARPIVANIRTLIRMPTIVALES